MRELPRAYVDTSAFMCLLKEEPTTQPMLVWLDEGTHEIVSSELLELELRRSARRYGVSQSEVTLLFRGVSLAAFTQTAFRSACQLPMPYLRSLDALHLQAALDMDCDAVLTYDARLADAASEVGLDVIAPG